jgi:hypothetical protein
VGLAVGLVVAGLQILVVVAHIIHNWFEDE